MTMWARVRTLNVSSPCLLLIDDSNSRFIAQIRSHGVSHFYPSHPFPPSVSSATLATSLLFLQRKSLDCLSDGTPPPTSRAVADTRHMLVWCCDSTYIAIYPKKYPPPSHQAQAHTYQLEFSIDDTEIAYDIEWLSASGVGCSEVRRDGGAKKCVIRNDSKKRILSCFLKHSTWDSEQAIVYVGRFSFSIYLVSERIFAATAGAALHESAHSLGLFKHGFRSGLFVLCFVVASRRCHCYCHSIHPQRVASRAFSLLWIKWNISHFTFLDSLLFCCWCRSFSFNALDERVRCSLPFFCSV